MNSRLSNLSEYLERRDSQAARGELDKKFFQSLESWIKKLSQVEFEVDEASKRELIIDLINKFIL
ncbi:hypothetical protein B9Q04_18235 [Candidatus Marsarchaeota G2 archaeon BE_D]|jgi:hypothetical protein|uniref:Uncharacterized protein n=1 Tax=Candidatus Marsarchaeota G2 archaeon BE_D TaxID=1978158 RepID=A0A2R6C544_9ARCH|nr:MAG: hypothetical protein B9Q04_18235 [Candidatus Marsarchaeota G2 archaeon BE_D]